MQRGSARYLSYINMAAADPGSVDWLCNDERDRQGVSLLDSHLFCAENALIGWSLYWRRSVFSVSRVESHVTTDGQSASLSQIKAPISALRPDFYYCQTVAGLLMWSTLWREGGSVIYNCFWLSPAKLFSGPSDCAGESQQQLYSVRLGMGFLNIIYMHFRLQRIKPILFFLPPVSEKLQKVNGTEGFTDVILRQ
jgi:hypothetical protein